MEKIKASRTIICEGKEYDLCEPTFDVYGMSMNKYLSGSGELDYIGAGRILFDACYIGSDLDVIQEDKHLYAALCLQASKIIEFKSAELKKN